MIPCQSSKGLWQAFFERNQWVFGYGLSYLFVTGFENPKLERVPMDCTHPRRPPPYERNCRDRLHVQPSFDENIMMRMSPHQKIGME